MSDQERSAPEPRDAERKTEAAEEAPPSTPFDSPWFIPVLLWVGAAWFGYDIVTDAEAYQKYPNFNRGGFVLLTLGALYTTWRAFKETRAARGGADDAPTDG
jgi:hypothetical protein